MSVSTLMDENATSQMLGQIGERTLNTSKAVTALDVKLDLFGERLSRVESAVEALSPVRRVVYGAVGFILVAVLGAMIALVVYRPAH